MTEERAIKIIKLFKDLHYIFWAHIYKEIKENPERYKDWGKFTMYEIKKAIFWKLFGKFHIFHYCFSCAGSANYHYYKCNHCFLFKKTCLNAEVGYYHKLRQSRKHSKILYYIRKIRDTSINWDINTVKVATNLEKIYRKFIKKKMSNGNRYDYGHYITRY